LKKSGLGELSVEKSTFSSANIRDIRLRTVLKMSLIYRS
jgi:hypothetical protein